MPSSTLRRTTAASCFLVVAGLVTALQGGSAGAATRAVTMTDSFVYTPANSVALEGDTVTWTNTGSAQHTVTSYQVPAGAASFDSSNGGQTTIAHNQSYSLPFNFSVPGTYLFYCRIHGSPTGGMRGSITVGNNGAATPGPLYGWGLGNSGQLGPNATLQGNGSDPSPVATGITNAVAVSSSSQTLALLGDGTVDAFGNNGYDQLGDSGPSRNTPAPIAGITNAVGVAAGGGNFDFSAVVLADGTVRTFGADNNGQHGDGTGGTTIVPGIFTVSGINNATQVSAGGQYALARLSDGTVKGWGVSGRNEFGDDSNDSQEDTPVTVPGVSSVTQVSAGLNHALAVRSDGTVYAWGDAAALGFSCGHVDCPVGTVPGITTATAVAAGNQFSLVLLANGTVLAFGHNDEGELGQGTHGSDNDSLTPVTVSGITTAVAIAANDQNGYALLADGTVRAWGGNQNGEAGDGTTTERDTPVPVAGLSHVAAINSGGPDGDSAFAITTPSTPDMSITKTHSGAFTQGQTGATYTLTARNSGTAPTNGSTVTVTDTLPAGLTAAGMSGTGWGCTVGTLTCTRTDALAANTAYPDITVTVNVANNAASQVTNTATVSGGGDTNAANNTANDPTTVNPPQGSAPDMTITKTHLGNFAQGQTGAAYTLTATNGGTAPTSGTVTVTDTLPTGLTATAASGTGWGCDVGTLTCTRSDALAAGSSYPAITVTVNVAANAARTVTNHATVSGGGETDTTNDAVDDQTHVGPAEPYHPVTPTRILDTRGPPFHVGTASTVGAFGNLTYQVTGTFASCPPSNPGCGETITVPATATGVVMNVAEVNGTQPGNFTLYPAGDALPNTANGNWAGGQTVSNLVEVAIGDGGAVTLHNASAGAADFVYDVAGWVGPATDTAGRYVPVVPTRLMDTRAGQFHTGPVTGPMASGTPAVLTVTGDAPVPASGVSAVVFNVTVTGQSGNGDLTIYPDGVAQPNVANLNYGPGEDIGNRVAVPVGSGGKVDFNNFTLKADGSGGGSVQIIADVVGYFTDATASPTTGTLFTGLDPPHRIADTRAGQFHVGTNTTLGTSSIITVGVAGTSGVPANATGVVLNVAVTNTSAASDLRVYPSDSPVTNTADINWLPGVTRSNLVPVKVGPDGAVKIENDQGNVDVVIDVLGWFA